VDPCGIEQRICAGCVNVVLIFDNYSTGKPLHQPALSVVRLVDWYRGYGATTPSHLGRKLVGPLCTAFSSVRQPQRRSTSSDMRALR